MTKRALFRFSIPLLLLLVLCVAAALRFYGLNWDDGIGAHPDERYLVGLAESLCWPDHLDPFAVGFSSDFAYGHFPVYVLALVGRLVQGKDLLLVGRMLAALLDIGTVALTFVLGRQIYDDKVGLLSAAFVTLAVLHVQQAHFYVVDVPLTFFVLGTLIFAVRFTKCGRLLDAVLAGMWAGMALGTKVSAVLLVLPLGAACEGISEEKDVRLRRGLVCGIAALVIFVLTNPFALFEFPIFWHNIRAQGSIVQGVLDVPYTRQFHGTWPYVYPIVQQLRWGMGWPLGLVAFSGLIFAVWRVVREPLRRGEWILLAWVVPSFAFTGALYAKFPRYLLPLIPLLLIYAARLLIVLSDRAYRLSVFLICFSLVYSFLNSLAFINLYSFPHPWNTASDWFYNNVPEGVVVAVEEWDHPLPLNAAGYAVRKLPVFDEETPGKWTVIERTLAEADYVIIASQRGYGTLARWPERYPLTANYYRQLFEGELGFDAIACFGRHPSLGMLAVTDDPTAGLNFALPELCKPSVPFVLRLGRLDESFVVYDHPQVVIFQRRP